MKKQSRKWGLILVATMAITSLSYADATLLPNKNISESLLVEQVITNYNILNELKVGKFMETKISENPSTGYVWNIQVTGDAKSIEFSFKNVEITDESKTDKEVKPLICGAGVEKTLRIKGLKKGRAVIKMTLTRPWEKNVKPIETRIYMVEVK